MKRWKEFWQRVPRLRVTLVRPGRETNPLAEQIMEQLHRATDIAQRSNESLADALKLIAELRTQLDNVREAELARVHDERLAAYFLAAGRVAEA